MAVLAADVNASLVGVPLIVEVSANAADTWYKGAIVYIDTAGGAQVTWATGDRPLGISPKQQVIAAAGDKAAVMVDGYAWLPLGTNIAAADEGELLIADVSATPTDNPADMVSFADIVSTDVLADNDGVVGRIIKVETARMLVYVGGGWTGALFINIGTTPASGYFA